MSRTDGANNQFKRHQCQSSSRHLTKYPPIYRRHRPRHISDLKITSKWTYYIYFLDWRGIANCHFFFFLPQRPASQFHKWWMRVIPDFCVKEKPSCCAFSDEMDCKSDGLTTRGHFLGRFMWWTIGRKIEVLLQINNYILDLSEMFFYKIKRYPFVLIVYTDWENN